MKNLAIVAALAADSNAHALAPRGPPGCCFKLTASGGTTGPVGQLIDGQNRIGGGLSPVTYCIDKDGEIADSSDRPCILTREFTSLPMLISTLFDANITPFYSTNIPVTV
jgi:hypothetical protein